MSRESSGWACEVSTDPRDNTQVRKIHFFDMGTPFNTYVRVGDQRSWAREIQRFLPRGYARQSIAMKQERRNCPSEKTG
jgi:hypothetical protein